MTVINLTQLDELLRAVRTTAEPIAAQLRSADEITTGVFETLQPHAAEWAGSFGIADLGRTIPEATRATLATRLEDAIGTQRSARAAIDEAFGAGTWMSTSIEQTSAFAREAQRVLLDADLGPTSADHAIDLLRQNGFAAGEAIDALQRGAVARLVDADMARYVDHADADAFARSARYAQRMQAAVSRA